jgi:hypothetical protein
MLHRSVFLLAAVAATAMGSASTITYSDGFSAFGRSMWGPGAAQIFDARYYTDVPWNVSGSTGGFTLGTGAELWGHTWGRVGMDFSVHADGGSVNATFPGTVQLHLPDTYTPGVPFTVGSSLSLGTGSLATSFTNLKLASKLYLDAHARFGAEECFLGACTSQSTGDVLGINSSPELFTLNKDGDQKFKVLGVNIPYTPGANIGINIPSPLSPLNFNVGNAKVLAPSLETAGSTESLVLDAQTSPGMLCLGTCGTLTSTISADRLSFCVTEARLSGALCFPAADAGKIVSVPGSVAKLQLPVFATHSEVVTGGSSNLFQITANVTNIITYYLGSPIPLTGGRFGIGYDLFSANVGAALAVNQSFGLMADPEVYVTLLLEETGQEYMFKAGESITITPPSDLFDMHLKPTYSLQGATFSNYTRLTIDPLLEVEALRLSFLGLSLGPLLDWSYQTTGVEVKGFQDSWELDFDQVVGDRQHIASTVDPPPAVVPEPGALLLVGTGLLALGRRMAGGQRS